jgi:hypothetical protein
MPLFIRRAFFVCLAGSTLLAAPGSPYGGQWEGRADSGTSIQLNRKVDGDSVSGGISLNSDPPKPISNRKVLKVKIVFEMPSMLGSSTHDVEGRRDSEDLLIRIQSPALGETTVRLTRR